MKFKTHFLGLCVLLIRLSTLGQDFEILSRNVVGLEMIHAVMEKVGTNEVEVLYRFKDGRTAKKVNQGIGTGFFIQYKGASYIITAKHVVGDDPFADGNVIVVNKDSSRLELPLSFARRAVPGTKWFFHPKADVALHLYRWPDEMHIANVDFNYQLLRTNTLGLLSPVCSLGFPFGFGLGPKVSPIATECKIASWLTHVPEQNPELGFILLDKALAQGYSGAPIYTLPEPFKGGALVVTPGFQPEIIGLLSGQQIDMGGGKVSLIVPASYILEIFQSPEFIEFEKGVH